MKEATENKKKLSWFQKLLWIFLTITLGLPQITDISFFNIVTTLLAFAAIIYFMMWIFRKLITVKNQLILKMWKHCRAILTILMSIWLFLFLIGLVLVFIGIE